MHILRKALIVALIGASAVCSYADEQEWEDLQDKAIDLYQAKRHDEAVATQARALEIAIEIFGPDDIKVAESMDNLAIYEQARGNNARAEELYKNALAILEKKLAPDDPYLGIFMNYVAGFYRKIGKLDEAKCLDERAKEMRSKRRSAKSDTGR